MRHYQIQINCNLLSSSWVFEDTDDGGKVKEGVAQGPSKHVYLNNQVKKGSLVKPKHQGYQQESESQIPDMPTLL